MPLLPTSVLPFWLETDRDRALPSRPALGLASFLAISYVALLYALLYSPSASGPWGWYPRLTKPAWALAIHWIGPIWAVLYGLIAIVGWRIWRTGAFRLVPWTGVGFAAQLLLQTLWSTLFFGVQSPALGLADLLACATLVLLLLPAYQALDSLAGRLWVLYLLWLAYATAVNAAIWWRN